MGSTPAGKKTENVGESLFLQQFKAVSTSPKLCFPATLAVLRFCGKAKLFFVGRV